MKTCGSVQALFSGYLDGAINGTQMQVVAAHLEQCQACKKEFHSWRKMQSLLGAIGPAKAPAGMDLRLRVAISRESKNSAQRYLDRWQMRWENALAPFLVRASAGFASSVVLLGTVILMIGTFATPDSVAANDTGVDTSAPKFLYSLANTDSQLATPEPVVIEASVDNYGRVYDYRVVSGPVTPQVKAALDNMLLMSVFTPARFYGQPVSSRAVMSFTRIAVRG